jgi:hypothetical protein
VEVDPGYKRDTQKATLTLHVTLATHVTYRLLDGAKDMNTDTLARIRFVGFAATGLICASYSVMSLATNTPNPMSPWLPGLAAGALIWMSAISAGRRTAGAAFDEFYQIEWSRAQQFAYWFAILLYSVFAVFLSFGWISPVTAFATMGTATGAALMLAFCAITLRS